MLLRLCICLGHEKPKIAPKPRKSQEIVEEDRISELPDCLILEILSRLPSTKYAIRTGTLSKRWEHLWTLVPTLIFKHWNDNNVPWPDYASFVDKTLSQCRQLKLKKFQVNTCCDIQSGLQVSSWIRYAIRCNVEELNLAYSSIRYEFPLDESFFISQYFTDLTLNGCTFYPIGAISWKNLRSLCISDGKLDEAVIENILSGSPLLETLILNDCYGYRRLNITSKSLKNLVLTYFIGCRSPLDIVAIKAPNILSLAIKGDLCLCKFLLVEVSSIVEAKFHHINTGRDGINYNEAEEEMLKGYILNLHHVKDLTFGNPSSKVRSRLEAKGFIFPSNVKILDVFFKRKVFGGA